MNLTKKQKILLDFIDGFIKGSGYSPTYREVMRALGYKSVSTVAKHIDNLVAEGYLIKKEGAVRSLEVALGGKSEAITADEWWRGLEREIARREKSEDPRVIEELLILKQALAIVQLKSD